MQKIIKGKKYDTETAIKLGTWNNSYSYGDIQYIEESLYKKRTGEFFLYGEGGPCTKYAEISGANSWSGGQKIMPLDYIEARKWGEEHLKPEEYESAFGIIEDDESKKIITASITNSTHEKIKRIASMQGMNVSQYIEDLILREVDNLRTFVAKVILPNELIIYIEKYVEGSKEVSCQINDIIQVKTKKVSYIGKLEGLQQDCIRLNLLNPRDLSFSHVTIKVDDIRYVFNHSKACSYIREDDFVTSIKESMAYLTEGREHPNTSFFANMNELLLDKLGRILFRTGQFTIDFKVMADFLENAAESLEKCKSLLANGLPSFASENVTNAEINEFFLKYFTDKKNYYSVDQFIVSIAKILD